ncbi:AlkA N-terminal domain-containing protein [Alteromonadaceae bacterium BrNp21-10]|nr:AlkA N-terminal domain-containing protein [Alteromonadaceae bacterium BrNp21-10]
MPPNASIAFQQARLSRDPRFDGQFYVAVKSTGIFCRPICPAKLPKEENVSYYDKSELAMQAGYRPCLRCRPDSAPHSFAWRGVDTTVERGLNLITHNLHLTMLEIANKLGVSDRYLRQLFEAKVGIAPKQFQIYHRLLFAKKLLHETHLSVEQVAFASGFNSARLLQSHLRKNMLLTPSQIRTQAKTTATQLQLKLAYRPPYDWPHLRDFLATRAISNMEFIGDNFYARTVQLSQSVGFFKAKIVPDKHYFLVDIELDNMTELHGMLATIRRILDVDTDNQIIESQLLNAGLPADKWRPGLRLPGIWNSFEAGCRAILGQQISVTAAIKLTQTLVEQCGDQFQQKWLFPTPQSVAQSSLLFLKMPDSRRQTLKRFAEAVAAQPNLPLGEWQNIKGIGPWTVSYAKMRGLSDPDVFLGSDLVIKKQLAQFNINPDLASPWGSYLTFLLWSHA